MAWPGGDSAVVLYSAGLVTLAACIWSLRAIPGALVSIGGGTAAAGLLTAGVANLLEDGVGLRALGIVYVGGVLIGMSGLVALAVGLFRGRAPVGYGGLVVSTIVGLLLSSIWVGYALLAGTWIAVGLRLVRRT